MTATAAPVDRDRNGPRNPAVGVPAIAPSALLQIQLVQLVESPWNPRKHFDPAKLAEMAESLRKGQLAPIIVRPIAGKHERYEIGAGHRRFRSAPAAGLTSLLAIVRDLDDVAFLELLTIENKQREDVAPLDEANGFKLLMEKAGYDVAKLAARIGLSTKYVYDRIKLLQLLPEAKKLLEDGTITAGHAILLARLTPADQKRVIGKATGTRYGSSEGGLFEFEDAEDAPDQGRLKLGEKIKPRSVRELATYINDHVRMPPAQVDPFLFPETAAALQAAAEEELKVVHISYDSSLRVEARDAKQRTYSAVSWKRADGKKGSKTCDYSCIGVVVAGPGRGDSLRVCVNRDKCDVHFKAARALAKRRAADRAKYSTDEHEGSGQADYWAREQKRRVREEARLVALKERWKKAETAILEATAAALKKLPADATGKLGKFILSDAEIPYSKSVAKYLPIGRTAEDLVRHIAFQLVAGDIEEPWDGGKRAIETLKPFGVNAQKLLDAAAPVEKPAKKPATKKSKKGAR